MSDMETPSRPAAFPREGGRCCQQRQLGAPGGSKGPMLSLSNPGSQKRLVDFPLAGSVPVGYLAPLCSFPAPAAPFPKDSRTLSRKPISQMPPGSARQGAELHALSWAQKPGVWGPARAWSCQSPVGWEPRGLLGLSPASTKRLAGRGTSVGRRPRKATVILGLTSASRWQCSGPLYSSH